MLPHAIDRKSLRPEKMRVLGVPVPMVSAATVLSAFAGGAGVKLKATPILTVNEGTEALWNGENIQVHRPSAG